MRFYSSQTAIKEISRYLRINLHTESPRMLAFMGLFVCKLIHWNARNDRDVAPERSDEAESRLVLVFAGNVRLTKTYGIVQKRIFTGFLKYGNVVKRCGFQAVTNTQLTSN